MKTSADIHLIKLSLPVTASPGYALGQYLTSAISYSGIKTKWISDDAGKVFL